MHHWDDRNDQIKELGLVTDAKHFVPYRVHEMDRTFDLRRAPNDEIDFPQPEEDLLDIKSVQILDHNHIHVAALKAIDDLVDVLV
ncbi:hypothetical protein D3C80_1830490 [compost metagenome]